jgi:hypothetical protein
LRLSGLREELTLVPSLVALSLAELSFDARSLLESSFEELSADEFTLAELSIDEPSGLDLSSFFDSLPAPSEEGAFDFLA